MTGLRKCLERAWDNWEFAGCDFAEWDKTFGFREGTVASEAEHVRLSRLSKIPPAVDPDIDTGG